MNKKRKGDGKMKKGLIGALSFIAGAAGAAIGTQKVMDKKMRYETSLAEKHFALFSMMNQWVKVKQAGKNLSDYFEKNGFKNLAVYGMSYAGETLIEELKNTDISVAYGIDKNAENIFAEVDVVLPEEKLGAVDAVVVTSITFFDEIEEMLEKKLDCPILSLEDILYEV